MLQLQCGNGHEFVDMFCRNQFCKEKRVFCHQQCHKIEKKHLEHIEHTEKIQKLSNYVKDVSQAAYELVEELELEFSKVQQVFQQIKNDILSKFSLPESVLNQLNTSQINDYLCNFVGFNEERHKISEQFKIITQQFMQGLQNCNEEFNIIQINQLEIPVEEVMQNSKPFQYVLMQENRKKQSMRCCSFTFNNDSSIIVAGLENGAIQIFELKNELIKEKQIIKKHIDEVYCLEFMQNFNQFVSGSGDASIIIWSLNDQQQWFASNELLGHHGIMLCLIINNSENMIFSGNKDSSIKIWDKQNNYSCIQTLNENEGDVLSLSLNPKQDMLISCAEEYNQIIVYQREHNIWKVYQKISIGLWGHRLCFIDNKRFTFQPNVSQFMEIYEISQETKFFTKNHQVSVKTSNQCDALFPQQFIRQKSILINKNGSFVNLLRVMPNMQIHLQESIDFGSEQVYGALNRDAEYLVTWDNKSQQIQLRKYKNID